MNNRIKKVIAITLTMISINVLYNSAALSKLGIVTKAYASESTSVYLKNLSLNKNDIDFHQDKFYYDVKVDGDVDEIKITAKPKSDDATVSIDDDFVDKNDNYRKIVSLEKGNNTVRIKVTNDEDYKIYTLNIVRGEEEQDNIYLDNINLSDGTINFSKENTSYDINVEESVDRITIGAIPDSDAYDVTIDGAKANKEDGYKQTVDLTKGKNPIIVKVKNNKNNDQRSYTLNINRQDSLEDKHVQDDIYLNYIKVDDKRINMDKDKTVYDLDVEDNTSQVDVMAEPEKSEYTVKINGKVVEDIDKFKDKIILKKGKNRILIKLQDLKNNKQRFYILNINVGNIRKSTDEHASVKCSQWILEDGKWKYNDSTGTSLKNTWFYDKNIGKSYYLQSDGTMATGWIFNNGKWYYLDSTGAMQRGWTNTNGNWYYLNSEGIMQVGWVKDVNGKYYYLQENGTMAKNTEVYGYKLGNDGAWIK
ncbi:N-acetylmuramoyl-L-alanine amidase family protein [Clostridium beijerinckii]|uniref:N-acetylmuramoyl-L-alanine amidase family protein n=1 Tax=Clostridium beijerinckii TaxID=1520 RepID=UPI0022E0B406|nr:cadherin-like beta sandwich domain-containing protein [Clostridium beijerinckii]